MDADMGPLVDYCYDFLSSESLYNIFFLLK